MFFEEDSQSIPPSFQPSLPLISEQDKANLSNQNTIKFQTLVNFFNRYSNMRGVKKTNYAKQFIKLLFKSNRKPQFTYPIIRLILPSDDRQRGNYGLKQKNLSKVIADSLNITKQDYLRLHHYKNPSFHKNGIGIGDFSLCVYDVVKSYCKQISILTISELNNMLDELVSTSKSHITIFRKLFMMCNAQQIKWIVRIILKDLKVSIKIDTILNTFHKDASDYYNLTNSLLETCKKFQNLNVSLDDQIKIFFPIRPMLAGKKKIGFFKSNQNITYYVQTKYDGQRLQAHKCKNEIKLFSRNAVDYTKLYEPFVQILNNLVLAQQCILDGEIIVIEKQTHKMTAFGMNKMVALNKQTDQYQLCFMVFDVLWLKQQQQQINLMKYPLRQRKQILNKIINQKQGILQIVKFQQIYDYDQILRRFSQSIDRNQEGIMLKDPSSIYVPKERASNWVKLKGDYVDGLTDTLDLIILGGYYGDSSARHGNTMHWTDQITSFLLGVISRIDPINPKIAYAIPFAKVGTGYSFDQLAILREKLKDNLIKFDSKFKPSYLECNWKPALQDKPDCWVQYLSKSIVLEIKAAEMIMSESYPAGYTLRFPRVVKIRYDKQWSQAQTMIDIEELSNASIYSKNLKRRLDDSDSDKQKQAEKQLDGISEKTTKKRQKKQQRKLGVYEQYLTYNMENEKLVSHLFSNFQFCVFQMNDKRMSKHEIQRQIMLHDGIIVQNPMSSTQYIITDVIDYKLRAFQSQKDKKYTFIKPSYIINCIKANKILPLSPLYLTVLPQRNSNFFRVNFDRFGDSYINFLDIRQLDQLLENMQGNYPINDQLINHISLNLKRKGKISYCINIHQLQKIKLKMQGNIIIDQFNNQLNSIIINGQPSRKQIQEIDLIKNKKRNIEIQFIQDLIKNKII